MTDGETATVEIVKPERLSNEDLENLDKSALIDKIATLFDYIELQKPEDIQALRESEEKCRQQVSDVTRRESMLLKSLTEKDREISDLASQIEELKQYQLPSNNQLRTMLLEPTVNVVINRLRKELTSTKLRLEESQSELNAWKFTQDSQTGKQLMARCRTLLKENEELGKQISQGRIAKLEGEIALEKKLVEEMKVAQNETEQFAMELDDDTEGLQATIYLLQQQLKEAKDSIDILKGNKEAGSQEKHQPTDPSPNVEPADQQTTDSTPAVTNPSESLTIAEKPAPVEPAHIETKSSEPLVNGIDLVSDTTADTEPVAPEKAEKLTTPTSEAENGLTSNVGNNGFTEMMVTN